MPKTMKPTLNQMDRFIRVAERRLTYYVSRIQIIMASDASERVKTARVNAVTREITAVIERVKAFRERCQ